MKFLDYSSLFDTEPVELALMSTFNFEPDYFERRLLRTTGLKKARRIAVFMDYGQWLQILSQDAPARSINQRYLVVPVRTGSGVFHPKMHLLVCDGIGRLLVGSGNLTRAGCSHNLELADSLPFSFEPAADGLGFARLASSALAFFDNAILNAVGESGNIAKEWIRDVRADFNWPQVTNSTETDSKIRLFHTYDGDLWGHVKPLLDKMPPKQVIAVSPFFDAHAEMIARISKAWPRCRVELVAQQGTCNVPIAAIKKIKTKVSLSEVSNRSRRLHAKLFAWEHAKGWDCIVGSANLTMAAWDGRNIETCLYLAGADKLIEALFDKQFNRKPVRLDAFISSDEREPAANGTDEELLLGIRWAVLDNRDHLRVAYFCKPSLKAERLAISIRVGTEHRPRTTLPVKVRESNQERVQLEQGTLADVHSALVVSLVAETANGRMESFPVWVIQKERLTHEPSEGGGGGGNSNLEDTGFDLPEFLEELGRTDGISAVIKYLREHDIRFFDGVGRGFGGRGGGPRSHDPFEPDEPPEWLKHVVAPRSDLKQAIYDFVERHQRTRLSRHADRGNINGMENFIDILISLVRMLYVYYVRKVVERSRLIGLILRCLEIATTGFHFEYGDSSPGYLAKLVQNHRADLSHLRETCCDLNLGGYLYAALLIVQTESAIPPEPWAKPKRARECHIPFYLRLRTSLAAAGVAEPTTEHILTALRDFHMFSEDQIARYRNELSL